MNEITMESLHLSSEGHPYYCIGNNFYSNEAALLYNDWRGFYHDFKGADIDMNLVFRFDIRKYDQEDEIVGYYMEVFIMKQRKGIFMPVLIRQVNEGDVNEIIAYLSPHFLRLKEIWTPFSNIAS